MSVLTTFKEELKARRHSPHRAIRSAVGMVDSLYRGFLKAEEFLTNGTYRSIVWVRLFSHDVHQTTPLTKLDRYPAIFSACKSYFEEGRSIPSILSFGCSTGEEVITLRRYFPAALITGAEINARSLAICRQHDADDRITFIRSKRATIRRHGPYDAIFCMAVLQRTPDELEEQGVTSLQDIYPFAKFDEQLRELDALLTDGGLLVVHRTQYRVTDSSIASRYEPLTGTAPTVAGAKFDRDGQRIDPTPPAHSIFVKLSSAPTGVPAHR